MGGAPLNGLLVGRFNEPGRGAFQPRDGHNRRSTVTLQAPTARNTFNDDIPGVESKILAHAGCAGPGAVVSCRKNREPAVATMTRDMTKGHTAAAVATVRVPMAVEALSVLILVVLLGLLTQAAWMHAT